MKNQSLHRIASYFNWLGKSKSWRAVHSPWLFSLLVQMRSPGQYRTDIESLRKRLKQSHKPVPIVDLGAGSTGDISTVAAIARRSLKRPKHARALSALCQHIASRNTLELGTSLGLTSAYLAGPSMQLITVEGNPHIAQIARGHWEELGISNIKSITGSFDEQWDNLAASSIDFDLIFIDGNHRGEALKSYIKKSLPMLSTEGVIVCDDIHWSKDMEAAWSTICAMECWTLQIDAFEWGLLTRNPALKREHVRIRF